MNIIESSKQLSRSEPDLNKIAQPKSDFKYPFSNIMSVRVSSAEQLTRAPVYFQPLTSGGHAKIYSVRVSTHDYIIKKGITQQDQTDLINEKKVLDDLSGCEHVVKHHIGSDFYNKLDITEKNKLIITEKNSLVLDKINGPSLDKIFTMLEESLSCGLINNDEYFNVFMFLFVDVLKGLTEIQEQNYVHGDIKPNNILYDKDNQHITYIDFGTSVTIGENLKVGHEFFASPEVIKGMIGHDVKANLNSDLWAVGQIIYKCTNSLLHNSTESFLSDGISKENSYSDRLANISSLIIANNNYTNGIYTKTASSIKTEYISNSPIKHTVNNFDEFESFNKNITIIFNCLEGIFNKDMKERISVADTLSLLLNDFTINEIQAKSLLKNIENPILIEAESERFRIAREKYQADEKT